MALLLVGNVWALVDAARFVSAPRTDVAFTLPGVKSDEGVGLVDRPLMAWVEELAKRARAGDRVIVLQGQYCPSENFTNPVGVLERLYLRLGHEMFRSRIVAVATDEPRYVTVPVVDIRTVLDTLAPGEIVDLDRTCSESMTDVWEALTSRFYLTPLGTTPAARFAQFRLEPLPPL
jgi:hypothetical protein